MPKASKATKKFQKNHLGRELTKRKHDQKKKAIRDKSLAKYAPKDGEEEPAEEDEEEAEAAANADPTDVFSTKAKSKPVASAAHRISQPARPATYTKPAAKKAPVIEDLDVDQFMDGAFLEDEGPKVDDSAIEDDGEDEEEEGEDADMDDDEEAALRAEIEAMESGLAGLQETDPEFYSHLKQHDKGLLEFNRQDLEDDEEEEDAAQEDGHMSDDEPLPEKDQEVLTMEGLNVLKKQVSAMSLKALKKLVRIFRSAVHIGSVAEARTKADDSSKRGKKKAQSEEAAAKEAEFRHEVAIHSPKVFHELIRFTLKDGVAVWQKFFSFDGVTVAQKGKQAGGAPAAPSTSTPTLDKHPKWNTVGPVLKAFLGHLLFFLSTLRSNPNESKMARFVLGSLEEMVRFFEPFPRLGQKLLKELLELWASSERNVRIDAFLRIRQLAIELTAGGTSRGGENMLELTLKGIYLTYVRHTKFTSALTLPVIDFMANCVVEIYGIDPVLSYQHAFVYIRQLAIHLRQALQAKKKDSHRMVYNWNVINCLRVWGKVLSVHGIASSASQGQNGAVAAADNLQALVYPYVQVCLGTLTVLPSSRYFPLRFHVCRFLIDLSSKVKVFVPLAPHLLTVFHAAELQRKPTASTRKVNDIAYVLKASKHVIATKTYQEAVVSEALHLLLEYFNIFSYSIAFNELILPTVKLLKKHSKEIIIHRVRKQITGFILKLEHNASWIAQKRNQAEWAPKDLAEKKGIDGIETFKDGQGGPIGEKKTGGAQTSPLAKYAQSQVAERALLDDSKADWNGSKTPKVGKKGGKGSDDEEDEEEKYQARKGKQQQGDEDDDEEMDEGDEGEDDDEMDGEEEDDDGEDDDEQPRKKSKSNGAAPVPRKAFEMPSSDEEDAGLDADQLEELAFSDDEEGGASKKKKKTTNRGGKKHAKQSTKKKEATAAASADKKRKRV